MLNEFVLLIEMLLILSLKHSFVLNLFYLNQLLLLLEVLRLTCILVMSNMSLILIDLLIEISMDFFSEKSHMLLHSLFNFLINQECDSLPKIMWNLIKFVLIWTILVISLLLEFVQIFLGSWLDLLSLHWWRVVNWWCRCWLNWNRNRFIVLLLFLLNWNLIGLMLLHFKMCQLLLSIVDILFGVIDMIILCFKILNQLLMVDNCLRPI